MKLEAQIDLTGKKIEFNKETIEKISDVFQGTYFQITRSEEAADKLSRLSDLKKTRWIEKHMKPYLPLPEEKGEAFQNDFDLFCKIL